MIGVASALANVREQTRRDIAPHHRGPLKLLAFARCLVSGNLQPRLAQPLEHMLGMGALGIEELLDLLPRVLGEVRIDGEQFLS